MSRPTGGPAGSQGRAGTRTSPGSSRRPSSVSPRFLNWVVGLVVADVLAWVLTIHAHLTYHRTTVGSPTIMPLGQLLGWVVSVGLLVVIILVLLARRQAQRYLPKDR